MSKDAIPRYSRPDFSEYLIAKQFTCDGTTYAPGRPLPMAFPARALNPGRIRELLSTGHLQKIMPINFSEMED